MATLEILGRLTASGTDISGSGGGHSIGGLKPSDIAGSLAGLSNPAYYLTMAKFCDDSAARFDLIRHVSQLLEAEDHKQAPGPACFDMLAVAIVYQAVDCGLCRNCQGTGVVDGQDCARCEGVGKKRLTRTAAAVASGVTRRHFVKYWGLVTNRYLSYLDELEGTAAAHLNRKLRD